MTFVTTITGKQAIGHRVPYKGLSPRYNIHRTIKIRNIIQTLFNNYSELLKLAATN